MDNTIEPCALNYLNRRLEHEKAVQSKMVAYWVKRHPEEVKRFRETFVAAYNYVAPKHGMEGLAL